MFSHEPMHHVSIVGKQIQKRKRKSQVRNKRSFFFLNKCDNMTDPGRSSLYKESREVGNLCCGSFTTL